MSTAHLRRPAVRWAAVLQTVLLALAGLLVTGAPAAASLVPGTVVTASTATLPAELVPLANGKRISYLTTAPGGAITAATGLVLTPKTGKKNKTVVWGHGSTGLADQCAPSASQAVFWPEARAAIAALLGKGWTVTAPDYPGLGTPAAHPYLIGESAGRSMIDSVKAARNLDAALSTQYVLDGHSQGGQGALFAGQLAPSYDGPLVLRGVAAIAPVSNLDVLAPAIPGTPGQGYLVMALYGLSTQDPSVNPNALLAGPARQRASVLQSGCLYEILDAYASLTAEELLVGGALPDAVVAKLARYGNPAQSTPSVPMLIVQGTADEAVPYEVTRDLLLPQLAVYRQPVEFVTVEGANHDEAVFRTVDVVARWIAARFG
ncbi:alpha/beta fold hydrolase [Jidongwangia harbinensis]|uniref:alpha/beta fold hydrolase n=1 Tax=Jidongwangia harbinensis TaxID=2878561 RepID=UPI001CD9434B|nr:alpha/beta fold hydrolase [Jidongwangia harbinensis]MCA2214195.1 lipase family protein [Jidongwangia harbinensis]